MTRVPHRNIRGQRQGLFGPAFSHAPVTMALAAACIAVFLFQEFALDPLEQQLFAGRFALIPARLFQTIAVHSSLELVPAPLTLLTSMFLHVDALHLVLNMLALISFGILVERIMGPLRFLLFYILCGLAGGVLQAAATMNEIIPVVGASGAILGVIAAAALIAPRLKIILFIVPMPLYVAVAAIVLLHAAAILFDWAVGIAWWAHVGGFAAGLVLTPLLRRRHPAG